MRLHRKRWAQRERQQGVHFKPVVDYTVIFTGTPTNIVFRNCRFDGALYVAGESTFFYGLGFAGSFTLENCEIKNYTSWMLADLNSDGTVQTGVGSALTNIVVKDCRFFDCRGSFAAKAARPRAPKLPEIVGDTPCLSQRRACTPPSGTPTR